MVDPRVTIVVGKASNDVIGYQNRIPWHLSEDLKHFRATTLGHTLIMGRNTYESIGKPLPGRRTIVLSRNPEWRADGVESACSLTEAIAMAPAPEQLFVVGGAHVYREALSMVSRLIVTEIDLTPEGDVFFPAIDPNQWRKTLGKPQVGSSGIGYRVSTYLRRES
jgi:dihydrofolate reductase